MKPRQQRSVMISRERINTGLNVRKILSQQSKHIGINTPLVRRWPT
jgi:hypothetical protein